MKIRWIVSLAALVLVTGTGYAWLARSQRWCAPGGSAAAGTECEAAPGGAATGSFDPVMSGACRFSCATQTDYEEKDVIAQPGARDGRLTRCPVSGVVFTVDAGRPHGEAGGREYVFCCDQCQAKFAKEPARYIKL
jgi:YHS domain-containing protein